MWKYLKDGDLTPGCGEGHGYAMAVGTEAITLPGRGEVEPLQVGEVGVSVEHRTLQVTKLTAGTWGRRRGREREEAREREIQEGRGRERGKGRK